MNIFGRKFSRQRKTNYGMGNYLKAYTYRTIMYAEY